MIPIFRAIMEQLRDLNQANDAYYKDRYGSNQGGFQISPSDGNTLSDYYRHKASMEADVAKNNDDNEWRFYNLVVAIPLT